MFRIIAIILAATIAANAQAADIPKADSAPATDVGLVIDNSGSLRTRFDRVIDVAVEMVDQKGGEDEMFLVRFVDASKIELSQDFTHIKAQLHDAIDQMYVEGGETALFDALKTSLGQFGESRKNDRSRVIVLITDGDEGKSSAKMDEVLKLLKDQKIRVFVVGVGELLKTKLLDRIAKETGGDAFYPKTKADVAAAAKQIWPAIRMQKIDKQKLALP